MLFSLVDFVINDWDYIKNLEKFLLIDSSNIIIADPYTLKIESSFSIEDSKQCVMIKNSKYALITM
jgi:hypothetical protein